MVSRTALVLTISTLTGSTLTGSAAADDARQDGLDWHLDVEAGTHVPLDVGGRINLEFPYRLRLVTSLGVMPGPYVDLVNEVIVAAGGYDENTAEAVAAALDTAFVWRIQAGWRPLPDWGWTIDAGYGLVTLGGDASGAELLGLILGVAPPMQASDRNFLVDSTLHMILIDTGYQWQFFDAWSVRAGLGFAGTLASSSTVELDGEVRIPQAVRTFEAQTEAYLDDTYTSYVFTPVVTLTTGYRFF